MTSKHYDFLLWQKRHGIRGLFKKIQLNGFSYLASHGLPTPSNSELWKYTKIPLDLLSLVDEHLTAAPQIHSHTKQQWNSDTITLIQKDIQSYLNSDFINLVFVDGLLCEPLSQWKLAKSYLNIHFSHSEKFKETIQHFKKLRKQILPVRQDSFEALNSAFHNGAMIIEMLANQSVTKPVQIIHYQNEKYYYPKCFVTVGERSSLNLIETFVGGSENSFFDGTSEISLANNAHLNYLHVQAQHKLTYHVACTRFYLHNNSNLESLSYSSGGKTSRHNLDVLFAGRDAYACVNGVILGKGQQHHDHHTNIEHVVGGNTSSQLYKSILADESRFVFDGRVHIRANAQKANSEQLNNNLLLSEKAEADSKPQLEIYADDVKATHGSTVGQLNAEEIFYLESRAISREQALQMLSLGFVYDLIERISTQSIKAWLGNLLKNNFTHNFTQIQKSKED